MTWHLPQRERSGACPGRRVRAPRASAAPRGRDPTVLRSGPRLSYVPALDGLRGLGLVFVLLFHGGFATARGSFLWVSMFFTLSGYLVTALALAEHRETGRVDVLAFWGRRARRLMPGALVTLAGIAVFGAVFADHT